VTLAHVEVRSSCWSSQSTPPLIELAFGVEDPDGVEPTVKALLEEISGFRRLAVAALIPRCEGRGKRTVPRSLKEFSVFLLESDLERPLETSGQGCFSKAS